MPPPRAVKARKRKRPHPRDWSAIRAEYVTNLGVTMEDLARKHHASHDAISHHAAREDWAAERYRHVGEVIALARQRTADDLARRGVAAFQELLDQMAAVRRAALAALVRDLETPVEELKKSDEVVSKVKHDKLSGETTTVTVRKRRALGDYRMAEIVLKNEVDLWRTFFGLGHAPADQGQAAPQADDGPVITIS